MSYLLRTLQAAFVAFSRLPLASHSLQEQHFRHAHYFLPLVGLISGLGMAAVYQLSALQLSATTSTVLALGTGLLISGALHEDGFADCCDGFGGGQNREHILAIMKDSRLGSYGVIGLIMLFGTKLALLADISAPLQAGALLTMATAARLAPLLLMAMLPYVQNSPSKMAAEFSTRPLPLLISVLFTAVCVLLSHTPVFTLYLAGLLLTFCLLARHYLAQRLQGYNGDCLGAVEQITECGILLLIAVYY